MDDTLPVWKKIYQVVSGCNKNVTNNIVEDILKLCSEKLNKVFLEYKSYTKESYNVWVKDSKFFAGVEDDEMRNFIHRLSIELDLDVSVAWSIICNFLMFEYYGKVDELKSIIRFESNVKCLIENIWYFYTADRMFLLKTMRHIFEKVADPKHMFYNEFIKYFKTVCFQELWRNLLKVFGDLIQEISKEKVQQRQNTNIERWIHRNNREQCEVLMLMIHTLEYCKLDGHELEKLLKLFIKHSFTKHPLYMESTAISRPKDLEEVKCAEIGCILMIANRYWESPGLGALLPRDLEKNLEISQMHSDRCIILFVWSVLKTSIDQNSLEYCNQVVSALIKKKVFASLLEVLSNQIFSNSVSGLMVFKAAYQLMFEFSQICEDHKYLYEQEGVPLIAALLMRHESLGAKEGLSKIFAIAVQSFPLDYKSLTEMLCGLIKIDSAYEDAMSLIRALPVFLSVMPWAYRRGPDEIRLQETARFYLESDLFIMPKNTLLKRYTYFGNELTQFQYVYNYYQMVEQNVTGLVTISLKGFIDQSIVQDIMEGFKLIVEIIKNYKGDFSADAELRRCIGTLNYIPAHFAEGNLRSFELVKVYFTVQAVLITKNKIQFSEAFPLLLQKKFLPQLSSAQFTFRQLFTGDVVLRSMLYTSLREEEALDDHSLLLEYINFVLYMVEKSLCHDEVQAAGLAYLTYAVFPHYGQWQYKDPHQMVLISKGCFTVFVKLLKHHPDDCKTVNRETFYKYLETFLNEEWFLSSFITSFVKDKFHLQTLMEQESDWIKGPVCDVLENTRRQLVLLLLLLKHRAALEPNKKFVIDEKISIFSKGISSYMVNAYNCSLAILSLRFLDVLARDETAPIMALMGLDYDQAQRIFLERLRDPMEDEDVKIHTIDLISTCITHQHGMTAAFFNVQCSRKWYDSPKHKILHGDTVTDFMIDYLQNIKKSRDFLRNPLQLGILRAMCNLWMSGKQNLIKDIISLDAFWPLLANPLFHSFDQSPAVYAYVFKIFCKQIFQQTQQDKNFLKILTKFFKDLELIKLFFKYILDLFQNLPTTPVDLEAYELLIRSWTELLVVIEKRYPEYLVNADLEYILVELSLHGIQLVVEEKAILCYWIDLCFITVTNWGVNCKNREKALVRNLRKTFETIGSQYCTLTFRMRDAILSIVKRVLEDLKPYFEERSGELLDLLEAIATFVDFEYFALGEFVWKEVSDDPYNSKEYLIPWMIVVNIMSHLLSFKNIGDCSVWFSYRRYATRLVEIIPTILKYKETVGLGKIAVHSLILYVKSPMAFDICNLNMVQFYDQIEPPLCALLTEYNHKLYPLQLKDGWVTLTMVMKLNQALINRFQSIALRNSFAFISLNEQIINHIIAIPEFTVDLSALDLVTHTLIFIDNILLNWKMEWYRKCNFTYNSTIMSIKKIINACIAAILRPKNITFYGIDDNHRLSLIEQVSTDVMAAVINKLINVIGLAFGCLYKVNPDLISMMGIYKPTDTFCYLVEGDFSVPKFESPITHDLTYGRLLCLAHFLCKSLNQLQQLNTTKNNPDEENDDLFRYVGIIECQSPSRYLPNQKLSTFLRYAMYEYSGLSDPWIKQLNYRIVNQTLELMLLFLAAQVFQTQKTMDKAKLPLYKRNLCSELQFFYDYAKKRSSELLTASSTDAFFVKSDIDVVNKFMIMSKRKGKFEDLAKENFLIIIAQWFIHICNLQ